MEGARPAEHAATAASGQSASDGTEEINLVDLIAKLHNPRTLLDAAERGEMDDVKRLLEQGHSVNKAGYVGNTVLHGAAKGGYVDVIVELLRNGALIDARNNAGETALYHVVRRNHLGAVQELIKRGASVDIADDNGVTPLLLAAEEGNMDVVCELIKNGADVRTRDNDGRSVLHYAADSDPGVFTQLLSQLLSSGADPAATTKDGKSVLSIAATSAYNKSAIVRDMLLATVLNKDTCSEERIKLFVAAATGDLSSVERLIECGESVDATTINGRTPLFYSAEVGHLDIVKADQFGAFPSQSIGDKRKLPVEYSEEVATRLKRERRRSKRYDDFIMHSAMTRHGKKVSMLRPQDIRIPRNYREAMRSPQAKFWDEAIQAEISALTEKRVLELVDQIPATKRAILTWWMLSVKTEEHGFIMRFKARLVARGFKQLPGIDYHEPFSPVARISSFRMLIALAAQMRLGLWQGNINTAYLNAELKEELYVGEIDGYPRAVRGRYRVCGITGSKFWEKATPISDRQETGNGVIKITKLHYDRSSLSRSSIPVEDLGSGIQPPISAH